MIVANSQRFLKFVSEIDCGLGHVVTTGTHSALRHGIRSGDRFSVVTLLLVVVSFLGPPLSEPLHNNTETQPTTTRENTTTRREPLRSFLTVSAPTKDFYFDISLVLRGIFSWRRGGMALGREADKGFVRFTKILLLKSIGIFDWRGLGPPRKRPKGNTVARVVLAKKWGRLAHTHRTKPLRPPHTNQLVCGDWSLSLYCSSSLWLFLCYGDDPIESSSNSTQQQATPEQTNHRKREKD